MKTVDSAAFDGLPVAGLAVVPPWKSIQKIFNEVSKLIIVGMSSQTKDNVFFIMFIIT